MSSCVLSESVLLCFMYFLSHLVSMLGLNLIASIPGPSILTTQSSDISAVENRQSGRSFQSLIVWGKEITFICLYTSRW